NSSEKGILFINLEGIITTYNDTAENLLNVPREKVIFHSFVESFPDNLFGFSMKETLMTKELPPAKSLIAETSHPIEVDATILLCEGIISTQIACKVEGILLLLRDSSEIRRRQAIEERNNRMKEISKMAAL